LQLIGEGFPIAAREHDHWVPCGSGVRDELARDIRMFEDDDLYPAIVVPVV